MLWGLQMCLVQCSVAQCSSAAPNASATAPVRHMVPVGPKLFSAQMLLILTHKNKRKFFVRMLLSLLLLLRKRLCLLCSRLIVQDC